MQLISQKVCEICDQEGQNFKRCRLCGAEVCSDCFNQEENVCLNCIEARCYICSEYLAARACNVCGKLVCEDHGTKIDESTICYECRKREV